MKQLSSNNLKELYSTKLVEVNWMMNEKKQHDTNREQGAYYMNLLLPEVEVGTNIQSDTQSHVTD